MGKFIKLFGTTSQYTTYTADTANFIRPNVSLCDDDLTKVYYSPYVAQVISVIIYTASAKLNETTASYTEGLHTNAFNATILSHEFADGVGTIGFDANITSIGEKAFYKCSGMTSATIPDTITSIGKNAFQNCSALESVNIPSGVTSIGNNAFMYCYSLTSVTIPSGVTEIGDYTFDSCENITSITIPSGVTKIGKCAFMGCGFTNIDIPDSVTSIGQSAFVDCRSLTSVTIGSGVTSIGNWGFQCSNLGSITSNAMTAPIIQSDTFVSVKQNGTLTVPNGSSGYDTWMSNDGHYLGYYYWTKVEQ